MVILKRRISKLFQQERAELFIRETIVTYIVKEFLSVKKNLGRELKEKPPENRLFIIHLGWDPEINFTPIRLPKTKMESQGWSEFDFSDEKYVWEDLSIDPKEITPDVIRECVWDLMKLKCLRAKISPENQFCIIVKPKLAKKKGSDKVKLNVIGSGLLPIVKCPPLADDDSED